MNNKPSIELEKIILKCNDPEYIISQLREIINQSEKAKQEFLKDDSF
ncbi:hypothetical protein [Chengkuizengella marina]|nr:hypothetical protein [Chengkuizengella marina]